MNRTMVMVLSSARNNWNLQGKEVILNPSFTKQCCLVVLPSVCCCSMCWMSFFHTTALPTAVIVVSCVHACCNLPFQLYNSTVSVPITVGSLELWYSLVTHTYNHFSKHMCSVASVWIVMGTWSSFLSSKAETNNGAKKCLAK